MRVGTRTGEVDAMMNAAGDRRPAVAAIPSGHKLAQPHRGRDVGAPPASRQCGADRAIRVKFFLKPRIWYAIRAISRTNRIFLGMAPTHW